MSWVCHTLYNDQWRVWVVQGWLQRVVYTLKEARRVYLPQAKIPQWLEPTSTFIGHPALSLDGVFWKYGLCKYSWLLNANEHTFSTFHKIGGIWTDSFRKSNWNCYIGIEWLHLVGFSLRHIGITYEKALYSLVSRNSLRIGLKSDSEILRRFNCSASNIAQIDRMAEVIRRKEGSWESSDTVATAGFKHFKDS